MVQTKVRPGSRVLTSARSAPRGANVPTGKAFIVGEAERGLGPTRVTSLASFERHFGGRQPASMLYDYVQTAFAEGLAEAWISRVVGPAAEAASVEIDDGDTTPTLRVTAESPGEWGNDLAVVVESNGDTFSIAVQLDGDEVETFTGMADADAAAGKLDGSRYVRGEALQPDASPADGTHDLSGGDTDASNIDSSSQQEALDRFTRDLGFGQVAAPDWTEESERQMLLDHAENRGRVAIVDAPEADGRTELVSVGESHTERFGMLTSSWVEIPAYASGARRTVPGSAFVLGLIARGDRSAGTANNAPAGDAGNAQYVLDVVTPFRDADDINALTDAGVNLIRSHHRAGVQLYGYRSLSTDDAWVQFSQVRLAQKLADAFGQLADGRLFQTVDGARTVLGDLRDDLKSELVDEWAAGGLFGETPDEAFSVDVSEAINPEEELAAGNLHALVTARFSPFAEYIEIELVRLGAAESV